jgi:hypothetical protein
MTADLLISHVLEAIEVGDEGVTLEPVFPPTSGTYHHGPGRSEPMREYKFHIKHPVHGVVGNLEGYHLINNNAFVVGWVHVQGRPGYKDQRVRPSHPYSEVEQVTKDDYAGVSTKFIRSGLRSLMTHIPGLKKIIGLDRVTGTHAIAADRKGRIAADTAVNIPRHMRQG